MGAGVCVKCGKPLYPGASFCGFCATPVSEPASTPADPAGETLEPPTYPPPGPAATPEADQLWSFPVPGDSPGADPLAGLSDELSLRGVAGFSTSWHESRTGGLLVRHPGISQRLTVAGADGGVRFTLEHNASRLPRPTTVRLGGITLRFGAVGVAGQAASYTPWEVQNATGTWKATLTLGPSQHGAFQSILTDTSEAPLLVLEVRPDGWTRLAADAALPTGEPLLSCGGGFRDSERIMQGPTGENLARMHHKSFGPLMSYGVAVLGAIAPMVPLMLAFVIERYLARLTGEGPARPLGRR